MQKNAKNNLLLFLFKAPRFFLDTVYPIAKVNLHRKKIYHILSQLRVHCVFLKCNDFQHSFNANFHQKQNTLESVRNFLVINSKLSY